MASTDAMSLFAFTQGGPAEVMHEDRQMSGEARALSNTKWPAMPIDWGPASFARTHRRDRDFFLAMICLIWLGIGMGFGPEIVHHLKSHAPPYPAIIDNTLQQYRRLDHAPSRLLRDLASEDSHTPAVSTMQNLTHVEILMNQGRLRQFPALLAYIGRDLGRLKKDPP